MEQRIVKETGEGFQVTLNSKGESIVVQRGGRVLTAPVGGAPVAVVGRESGVEVEIGIPGTNDRLVAVLEATRFDSEIDTLESFVSSIQVKLNGRL